MTATRLLIALALTFGLAAVDSARAADPLARLLPLIPAKPSPFGFVFGYQAVVPGEQPDARTQVAVEVDVLLRMAPYRSGEAMKETGIDFTAVEGLLQAGDPPNVLFLVAGRSSFASGVAGTLAARGFTTESGTPPIHSLGAEDNSIGVPGVGSNEPFSRQVGVSQRIAVLGDVVVASPVTALVREALAMRLADAKCEVCAAFAALTTAAEKARGAPGTVVAAQGMTIAFHAGVSGGPVGLLVEGLASGGNVNVEELEKKFEAEMAAGAPIPLHLLSLFLVAESATAQWAQIALLYADRNSAEIAAPIILERLAAFLPEAQRIASAASRKVDFADGPIGTTLAVLTLAYPADPPFAARREASLWLQATYNRQFTVLDPTR